MMQLLPPEYCNPEYEWARSTLMKWLNERPTQDCLATIPPHVVRYSDPSPDPFAPVPEPIYFYRHRAVAGAPYVGDEFRYIWDHAVINGTTVAASRTRRQYRDDGGVYP
jgi:hypothetical protein